MAFDLATAARIREVLYPLLPEGFSFEEKNMFGGLAFLVGGNMTMGVIGDRAICRMSPQDFALAIHEPLVSPMDFTGRPTKGWLFLEPDLIADPARLLGFAQQAIAFTRILGPKDPSAPKMGKRKTKA